MRYHSNIKTISISILVALLFFTASFFILFTLNLTSPTLIVTNRILDSVSKVNSDVSFKFDGMERNFRDRVMIRDFSLYYKGENIASFDKIEVKLGLFDVLSYLLNIEGSAEIDFLDGSINVPLSLFSSSSESTATSDVDVTEEISARNNSSFMDYLTNHNLTLVLKNVDFSFDYGSVDIEKLEVSAIGTEGVITGALISPSASISYDSYSLDLSLINISFSYGESIFLTGSLNEVSLNGDEVNASLSKTSFSLRGDSIDAVKDGDIQAVVNIDKIKGGYNTYSLSAEKNEVILKNRALNYKVSTISAESPVASFDSSSLNFTLENYDTYNAVLGKATLDIFGEEADISDLSLSGSIKDKNLSLLLSSASSNIEKKTENRFGSLKLEKIEGKVDYNDDIEASLGLKCSVTTTSDSLDDISFSLSSSLIVDEGVIKDGRVEINELYLGLGEKYNSSFRINGDLNKASITFDYGPFDVDISLSISDKKADGTIAVNSLEMSKLNTLLNLEEDTVFNSQSKFDLSSSFNLFINEKNILDGNVDYSLSLSKIKLGIIETSVSSNGNLSFEDEKIAISSLSIDTSYFSLNATGYFDTVKMLPNLDFASTLANGSPLLNGYIHLGEGRSYNYYGDIKYLENTFISGIVDFNTDNLIISTSFLETNGLERPFNFSFNLDTKTIALTSSLLTINVDYSDGISGSISADNLKSLRSTETGEAITLNGDITFSYNLDDGLKLNSSRFEINTIFLLPSSPSLSFSIDGSGDYFELTSIKINGDDLGYSGLMRIDLDENVLGLSLKDDEGKGEVMLSLYKDTEYVASLKADNINLSPLGLDNMYGSITLFGNAARVEDFFFDGSLNVIDSVNENNKISASVMINGDELILENIVYSSETINSTLEKLYFDSKTGTFGLDNAIIKLPNEKGDRAYPIETKFSLSAQRESSTSLISSISSLIKEKGVGTDIIFSLDYIDLDSSAFRIEDRYLTLSLNKDNALIGGDILTGSVDYSEKNAQINVTLPSFAVGTFNIDYSRDLDITADIKEFNMALVNFTFKYPTLVFRNDLVGGNVSITRTNGEYNLSGSLECEELGCDVFWIEDQSLIFHNARFIIWDNELKCSFTYVTVFDKLDFSRKMVRMMVGVSMTPNLSMEGWECEVYIDGEENAVRVRIPLYKMNVDILGYVTGHYRIYSDSTNTYNEGELNLYNTSLSIGMNDYPEWYNQIGKGGAMDMTFNFKSNNRILYPAGDDPIFSITLQENSALSATYDSGNFTCSGDIQIRGGEIFYFQKYFYITSGSITFDDPNEFNPRISLRATLRDYDSSSERVEIYLVLNNNTFDNISPTLESSPAKDLSEIMEILGQSILPQSAYGSVSVSSVASLVSEGFDILSRLGIVTTTTNPLSSLSTSLKKVFGVDTFSLHSNILNNIVADTLSQATASTVTEYSPMARFLNGTTLNIGKYLSQNLYLSIMVHLGATKNKTGYTIIADDLALDTEFSIEWTNDARFTVTFFTRPSYFSFYSILSTFGFTITKTINF